MRVLVTGSQLWTDKAFIFEELDCLLEQLCRDDYVPFEFVLVHGHCPNGADAHADEWGKLRKSQGFPIVIERHPADWKGPRKKGAGYARNAEMVKLGADICLAFILNNSNGSTHCRDLAEKAGIMTYTHNKESSVTSTSLEVKRAQIARRTVEIRNVMLMFRNLEGREELYNREGDRNFHIVLDEPTAQVLGAEGYNVKRKPSKEEDGEQFITLKVKVNFKGRPPTIALISKTKGTRNTLTEDVVSLVDYSDFASVDVEISPYDWKLKTGETGRTAYLQTLYGILYESPLDQLYAEYVEEDAALNAAQDIGIEDLEILADTGWEVDGEPKALEG